MEIFLSKEIDSGLCVLSGDEASHCVKVLRHRVGDGIAVIDGEGTLYRCRIIEASPAKVVAEAVSSELNWGAHPYRLHLAVAPTKNADRYEWFAEKACEVGVDVITPVIGEHSERKVFKPARVERILVSAAKQSLKGAVPQVAEPMSVKDFILRHGGREDGVLKLIAYCFENEDVPRISIKQALKQFPGSEVIVMIGPEGDFSQTEAELALNQGFIPVHLGNSRLRTETAAVTAAEAVYFKWME